MVISAIPNRLINIGYNNHKFALIEKEAKPGSNYIIFDDIETMLNYKESIKDQYGIESEVYHIDTNNFDLEKVNIYGKLYERYYFTSESLPMVKVEFKPSDDFITKSVLKILSLSVVVIILIISTIKEKLIISLKILAVKI